MEPDEQQQAIIRLESQLAHLQRHVEQQDREIYRQGELLKRVVQQSEKLRERMEDMADAKDIPNERPPHY
ncbi:SlyX family protein [Cerasicoccus fimbriatus]|uniref:SlyX family protein n=1 Tax=Cerasicoccus fimbriatus TaxID=3014554 RepID=UPI0022B3BA51|nr:SlyX family protein [Cerasicoccus sp. TK19100]